MDNIAAWITIVAIGILFGILHYRAGYYREIDKHNSYFKFLEAWRLCVNYFIVGIIVYYFVSVRGPDITKGAAFSGGDFILGIIFLIGIFGWLPYFIKNITEGITVIFQKILNREVK